MTDFYAEILSNLSIDKISRVDPLPSMPVSHHYSLSSQALNSKMKRSAKLMERYELLERYELNDGEKDGEEYWYVTTLGSWVELENFVKAIRVEKKHVSHGLVEGKRTEKVRT